MLYEVDKTYLHVRFSYSQIDLGLYWRVHVRLHASPDKDCIICHMKSVTQTYTEMTAR